MKKEEKKKTVAKKAETSKDLKPLKYEVFHKDGVNYEKITLPDGKVIEREQ